MANWIIFHEYNAATDPKYDGYMLSACGSKIYDTIEHLLKVEQSNGKPLCFS